MHTLKGVKEGPLSVRVFLAEETAAQHQALHDHPLFSKLTQHDLTPQAYAACVLAHHRAFQAVEAARRARAVYSQFSLGPQVDALSRDVDSLDVLDTTPVFFDAQTDQEVLGALYVIHGAQFGRAVIRKALQTHLTQVTDGYFFLPPDTLGWKAFLKMLEDTDAHHIPHLLQGAKSAFALMRQEADRAQAMFSARVLSA